MKTEYVVGFALWAQNVMLIEKRRPKWQAGKLNGIGGHIEPGESAHDAMAREFMEESGVHVHIDRWKYFAQLTTSKSIVHMFTVNLTDREAIGMKTTTDETVTAWPIKGVSVDCCLPNLRWLVPMATIADSFTEPAIVCEGDVEHE